MIIPSQSASVERPAVIPVLFPECVPAHDVNHLIHLPEPLIQVPPVPKRVKPVPAEALSLLGIADAESDNGQFRPSRLYRLKREPIAEVTEVVERAPNRIVEILELGYPHYEQTHPLQAHVRQAVRMMLQCRTAALGGHVDKCPDGHIERAWYNSCGHRFCPRCAYRKQQEWLKKQRKKLLPVRHFHTTFTIPHEFNKLWWCNFAKMANLLFHTSAQALQDLMTDPKRTGVQVGIIAALHTWDDQLLRHPHLHCLVTGGGLTPEGAWKDSSKPGDTPFLVSVKALMQRFRRLFCRKLKHMIKKEQLNVPDGSSTQQMLNIINKVNRRNWGVYAAKPPEDGGPTTGQMLAYQANAVAGGPISHMRIKGIERKVTEWVGAIAAGQEVQTGYLGEPLMPNSRFESINQTDDRVIFRWGKFEQQRGRRVRDKTDSLSIEKFIERLLWHVTPPNFHAIRQYGLYAGAKNAECEKLRAILPDLPESEVDTGARAGKTKQEDERIALDKYMEERTHCPTCGKKLVLSRVIPSSVTGKLSPRDKARARALTHARRRGG